MEIKLDLRLIQLRDTSSTISDDPLVLLCFISHPYKFYSFDKLISITLVRNTFRD